MAEMETSSISLLGQMEKLLQGCKEGTQHRNEVLDEMLKIVLDYQHPEVVIRKILPHVILDTLLSDRSNPTVGEAEHSDELDDIFNKEEEHRAIFTKLLTANTKIPRFLKTEYHGSHPVTVIDIYLSGNTGTLSRIHGVVINPKGFPKAFCVLGGYGRSVNRTIRSRRNDTPVERIAYVVAHVAEDRRYVARIISFEPAHALDDKERFDLSSSARSERYEINVKIWQTRVLGGRPDDENGQPVDIAVQQKDNFFGFCFPNQPTKSLTCGTVKKGLDIDAIALEPRPDRIIALSPYMLNPVNLSCLFVPQFIKPTK